MTRGLGLEVHEEARLISGHGGEIIGGADLLDAIDQAGQEAGEGAGVVVVALPRTIQAVVAYLGFLAAGRPVIVVDPESAHERIVSTYRPSLVVGALTAPPDGYEAATHGGLPAWRRVDQSSVPVSHPKLMLLLSTSGSTGLPRLVRLSRGAVRANAWGIAKGLALTPGDVGTTSLPLSYTFGLSVLHSALTAGAGLVVTADTLVTREFWGSVKDHGVTLVAGVPYSFSMLKRSFDPAEYPSVHTLLQAGGRLDPADVAFFRRRMAENGGRLVVGWGQVEGTTRLTMWPLDAPESAIGTVGVPIAGGSVSVAADGELVYEGPNVMMGYAEGPGDLAEGDKLRGVLHTGDLGSVDGDGYVTITGRKGRDAKVLGRRVALDEVEAMCSGSVPVAAVRGGNGIVLYVETQSEDVAHAIGIGVMDRLRADVLSVEVRLIEALPRLSNGKVDYTALT